MNELNITDDAKAQKLVNLIQQTAVLMTTDHIALQLPKYEISLRKYIQHRRNHKELNSILIQVVEGLK